MRKRYFVEVEEIEIEEAVAVATVASEQQSVPHTEKPAHSQDFASVNWFGELYGFTRTQRRCVAVLWAAWENGTPDVSESVILSEADSDSGTLRALFFRSPAWGTLVIRSSSIGGPVGCFRLAQPE